MRTVLRIELFAGSVARDVTDFSHGTESRIALNRSDSRNSAKRLASLAKHSGPLAFWLYRFPRLESPSPSCGRAFRFSSPGFVRLPVTNFLYEGCGRSKNQRPSCGVFSSARPFLNRRNDVSRSRISIDHWDFCSFALRHLSCFIAENLANQSSPTSLA